MKSVYVCGSLFQFGNDYTPIYKQINELCEEYFDKVIGTYPDFMDMKESPKDFYKRAESAITKCDLFVAEMSSPSHGVGIELQMAQERNIPVIALVRDDVDLSNSLMLRGLPVIKTIISYMDEEDLLDKLEKELDTLEI